MSHSVALGEPIIRSRDDPADMMKLVELLNEEQRKAVCDIGFSSMLNLKCSSISRGLCQALVPKIDHITCQLNVHGIEVSISQANFSAIMGIGDGGVDVQVANRSTFCGFRLKERILKSLGNEITTKSLRNFLSSCSVADSTFKVCFVMYALATVLCPTEDGPFGVDMILNLQDTNTIAWRDWSSFCVQYFMAAVRHFSREPSDYFAGSLMFVQLLYCHALFSKLHFGPRIGLPIETINDNAVRELVTWIWKHGGVNSTVVFDPQFGRGVCKKFANGGEFEDMQCYISRMVKEEFAKIQNFGMSRDEIVSIVASEISKLAAKVMPNQGKRKTLEGKALVLNNRVPGTGSMETEVNSPHNQEKEHHVSPVKELAKARRNIDFRSPGKIIMGKKNGPPEQEEVKRRKRIMYPFKNRVPATDLEEAMLLFVFPKGGRSLTEAEKIMPVAQCGRSFITRGLMSCLRSGQWLVDDVINIMAEYLNHDRHGCWFLTSDFKTYAVAGDCDSPDRVTATRDTLQLEKYEDLPLLSTKIFIPIHEGYPGHWFLMIVDPSRMEAIIYDSLPNAADKMHREGLARKCLEHLDRVLSTRRRELPRRLKYGGFLIIDAEEELNPIQTDNSECGVYVITHMEHRGGLWPKGSIVSRLRIQILLKILSSPYNEERKMVETLIRSEMEARAANARATRTSSISGRTIVQTVKAREIARRS